MAEIDVTDLMSDPDFIDEMVQIKRTSKVNSYGENIVDETKVETVGSIQPATGRALKRLPEALLVENVSSFWMKGKIVASEPGRYTDILVFKGQRYQVLNIFDWTNWGEGYCEGVCIAEVIAP